MESSWHLGEDLILLIMLILKRKLGYGISYIYGKEMYEEKTGPFSPFKKRKYMN